jgi:glyoxylate/hydroxypyruvate reductase A
VPTTVALYHPTLVDRYLDLLRDKHPNLQFIPASDEQTARSALASAEILLAHISFSPSLLSDAPRLQWIQMMGAGVDRILPDVPTGVRVSRLTGTFGKRMAEYVLAYVLGITQRIPDALRNQIAHDWRPMELRTARGRTIGVAGLGSIGSAIAEHAAAFGMTVTGTSTQPRRSPYLDEWFDANTQLDAFLGSADFVVLALPSTPATHHIIDDWALASMRPDAWLINVSRGSLVDEAALLESLRRGRPAGAVLDVFEEEPLRRDHPFWDMMNVLVTPHHSGAAIPDEAVEAFGANLPRFWAGERLIDEVDLARGY